MDYHEPVLLNEVLENLKIEQGKKYIDCTLGDGGHTIEILKKGGIVLGIEVSEEALARAKKRIAELNLSENFVGALGNFKNIKEIAEQNGFSKVDGILFDLGYSSYELDDGGFGLSFLKDEPLDMRLDKTLGVTAADLLNMLPEDQIARIISGYSDEKMARKFARAIVSSRSLKKIQTTKELADLLRSETSPGYEHGRIHPATRTFQALRIAVNDEVANLEKALPQAARLLLPGGRMLVISFQSLEDTIAKQFGRSARPKVLEVTKKPLIPTDEEIRENSRSRSAKLRIFECA